MGYKNFKTAIYCTVGDMERMAASPTLASDFSFIEKHIKIDKVYLETYRGRHWVDRDKVLRVKGFFEQRGLSVSGGITPDVVGNWEFKPFCYTNSDHREELEKVVAFTAALFDEVIFDDFYFTNCRCESCIAAKGERTWAEFRTAMLQQASTEIVIATAKRVNPDIRMIIKYPNWYDDYQNTGYNLEEQPKVFDEIYTGTETRDPVHTQQNLQRYLSYFLMRYLENVKPGHNGGGWFDTFDCMYNLGSYAEQCYLTLFSKAKELTLFSMGLLLSRHRVFVPIAGYAMDTADAILGKLGTPQGIACYKPYHSSGENYLHGYLGMLGLPLEPTPVFPSDSRLVLLTESAKADATIVERIKKHLLAGNDVVMTSGLLRALGERGIDSIAAICCSERRATVSTFAFPMFECAFGEYCEAAHKITIPQIEFSTNDCTPLVVAMTEQKNYPVLLKTSYGTGTLYVLAIPDDFGELYHLPAAVLGEIRKVLSQGMAVTLRAPSNVGFFAYDNGAVIVESFLPHNTEVTIVVRQQGAVLTDIVAGGSLTGVNVGDTTEIRLKLAPASYRAFSVSA